EMNALRLWVASSDLLQRAHVGRPFAISAGEGQSPPREWFDDAENVCGAAADVLVIPPRDPARFHRHSAPCILPQHDRPLVQANDGLHWIELTGVEAKNVLHPLDERGGQLGNAPHFFPPRLQAACRQRYPSSLASHPVGD